jgi:hypothetical protein
MIGMAIGVTVLGSVMATVIHTSVSSRTSDNLGKLTEDAQITLDLIANHVRMAGFSQPRLNTLPGVPATNYTGVPIRGCDGPMADRTVAMDLIGCGPIGPNEFSVAYEADLFNTVNLANLPTDCLGRPVALQVSPFGGNFAVAENRFYIADNNGDPALFCAGNGAPGGFATPMVLAENVEDMRVTYGLAGVEIGEHNEQVFAGRTNSYATANQLDVNFAVEPVNRRWNRVASVRLCLQLRTNDNVTDQPTPFVDCQGNLVTPGDRRLRVSVVTTIVLKNRTVPTS